MSLNQEQIDLLLQPIAPGRVRTLKNNAHLEAWDVRRWLLRVFGWGGWDFTVKSCDVVSERSKWDETNPLVGRHTVVYRVIGILTIRDAEGQVVAQFEDGAMGDGINQPSLMAAHDFALKTAMSQALKRCAVNLGDTFGLSLYAKGSYNAVVGRSVAHQGSAVHDADEDVKHGELDPEITGPHAGEVTAPSAESTPSTSAAPDGPAAPSSLPEAEAQQDTQTAARVQAYKEKILATKDMDKTTAIITMGRIKLDISKDRLNNADTTTESGEVIRLGVFADNVLKFYSRSAA